MSRRSTSTFGRPAPRPLKSASGRVKRFLVSSAKRFRLLVGLCAHVALVLVFRVRCDCALCAALVLVTVERSSGADMPSAGGRTSAPRELPAATLAAATGAVDQPVTAAVGQPPATASYRLPATTADHPTASAVRRLPHEHAASTVGQAPATTSYRLPTDQRTTSAVRELPAISLRLAADQPVASAIYRPLTPTSCRPPPLNTDWSATSRSQRHPDLVIGQPGTTNRLPAADTTESIWRASSLSAFHPPLRRRSTSSWTQAASSLEQGDAHVLLQPPYAMQDAVEPELRCALLSIIDRIYERDYFHKQCSVTGGHYSEYSIRPEDVSPQEYPWRFKYPSSFGLLQPEATDFLDEPLVSEPFVGEPPNLWSTLPCMDQREWNRLCQFDNQCENLDTEPIDVSDFQSQFPWCLLPGLSKDRYPLTSATTAFCTNKTSSGSVWSEDAVFSLQPSHSRHPSRGGRAMATCQELASSESGIDRKPSLTSSSGDTGTDLQQHRQQMQLEWEKRARKRLKRKPKLKMGGQQQLPEGLQDPKLQEETELQKPQTEPEQHENDEPKE